MPPIADKKVKTDELLRLNAIMEYNITGIKNESEFDSITEMAAHLCNTTMSFISIVTDTKQIFISSFGANICETNKDIAFCAHAIKEPNTPFIIEDATKDPRFSTNPLTISYPNIVFYAGIPLLSEDGFVLGTLCVIKNEAHSITELQLNQLKNLASITVKLLTLRKKENLLHNLNQQLEEQNLLLHDTQTINNIGVWELDMNTNNTIWSETVFKIHEVPLSFEHNKANGIAFYHQDYQPVITKALENCIIKNEPFNIICQFITAKGNQRWVRSTGRKVNNKLIGSFQDITDIKDSANKLEHVIDGTNIGTWEWNVQTGETVFNRRWAEIVGYTLDELAPIDINTWVKLCHPDDLKKSEDKLKQCFEKKNEFYEVEIRMKHKSGNWVWVFDRGKVFSWTKQGEPLLMFGTHQDITLTKERESELIYQKELLHSLFELSPVGIALNEYSTGKFIDFNAKFIEPTGYTKEEFLQLSYWDLTPKEYADKEQIALVEMESKGYYSQFEKEYIRKNGTRYPVSLQGVVVNDKNDQKLIWSIVRDISKEKEAEKQLKEAIAKLQSVLNASIQVSIIATDTQGIITLFNTGAEQMLGYTADELVGKQTPVVIHLPEEIEKESKSLSEKYGKQVNGFETFVYEANVGLPNTKEWTYITKNGHQIPVLLAVNKVVIEDTVIGYLGIAKDISTLKNVEKEIRSVLNITEKQNERLQNFAFIVSHNLRSHSSGIYGLLNLLITEFPEFVENEYFDLLFKAAKNLNKTVEELTEIVKLDAHRENVTDINIFNIVEKNIQSLQSKSSEVNIKIVNQVCRDFKIKGIYSYLDSIVLNMITNAIKYKRSIKDSYVRITTEQSNTTKTIYFEDNGQGIDLEKHGNKLFGMYEKFHNHADSIGIGLYIVKNQVESMNGSIKVQSTLNEGTTFMLTFPI